MEQAYWNTLLTRCPSTNRTFIWLFLNIEERRSKANLHLARKFLSSEIFSKNLEGSTIEASGYVGSGGSTGCIGSIEDHTEVFAQFNFSYITAIWQCKARSSS